MTLEARSAKVGPFSVEYDVRDGMEESISGSRRAKNARPPLNSYMYGNAVVISIVGMAMKLAPYGVTALIFGVTSRFGLALMAPLGGYILKEGP